MGGAAATQHDALTAYVTQSQDLSWDEAEKYLEAKAEKTAVLDELDAQGKAIDGAYFDGAELTVITNDAATATAAKAKGITVKQGAGQAELTQVADRAAALMEADGGIQSVGPDLTSGTVKVRVGADAEQATLDKLAAMDGVQVVKGDAQGLTTHADVIPGQIMDLEPGTNCSLGFPGMKGSDNVMLTAGHCVEGMPDVLNAQGEHFGKGVESEFATGQPSVDMGLMDVDEANTGQPFVDTRGPLRQHRRHRCEQGPGRHRDLQGRQHHRVDLWRDPGLRPDRGLRRHRDLRSGRGDGLHRGW